MNLVELAQRIKTRRTAQRLTLEQVAQRTGLTRSQLSKVENFRVTPSLPALGEIAKALDISVSELVDGLDARPKIVLVRKNERKTVERDRPHSNIKYESLAYKRMRREMNPFLLTVPPLETNRPAMGHEGVEFMLVIAGKVDFEYDNETFSLSAGDALYFDGNVKHRLLNPSKKQAEVLCVFHGDSQGSD